MVLVSKIVHALAASCLAIGSVAAVAVGAKPNELLGLYKRQSSQNIVSSQCSGVIFTRIY